MHTADKDLDLSQAEPSMHAQHFIQSYTYTCTGLRGGHHAFHHVLLKRDRFVCNIIATAHCLLAMPARDST